MSRQKALLERLNRYWLVVGAMDGAMTHTVSATATVVVENLCAG